MMERVRACRWADQGWCEEAWKGEVGEEGKKGGEKGSETIGQPLNKLTL